MSEYEVQLENMTLYVEVTYCVNQPPNYYCKDSADDFYGYKELEWQLNAAVEYTEDNQVIELSVARLRKLEDEFSNEIDTALWDQIETPELDFDYEPTVPVMGF